jgi:membrane associated rhomboid family serine protease
VFPIRDVNPTRITPYVTLLLIAINVIVFFVFQQRGDIEQQEILIFERAAIACEVTTGSPLSLGEFLSDVCQPGAQPPIVEDKNVFLAVFTSMFLHGSVGHVLFNMWFLWIFGNNVEEAFGHSGYLGAYLLGGIVATLTFVFMNPESVAPLVGASGAIAFALGSYAVLFPGHRVQSLVGWLVVPVPAVLFLAIWFFLQFSLFGTNTAWEAHVGGFVFGVLITLPFRSRLLARV